MTTAYHVLNPYTNTAILLPGICDDGRDILIDMSCAGNNLIDALAKHGRTANDIAHVLITHDHSDHFIPKAALLFRKSKTVFHIPQGGWLRLMSHPFFDEVRSICIELHEAGMIHILPHAGDTLFGGVKVCWQANWHDDTINFSYRIRELLISGDVAHHRLFRNPDHIIFANRTEGPVHTAFLQTNFLDEKDAYARGLNKERIAHMLEWTGCLQDLLTAIENPRWSSFFQTLTTIIPHHFRIEPRDEVAQEITNRIHNAAQQHGYSLTTAFTE